MLILLSKIKAPLESEPKREREGEEEGSERVRCCADNGAPLITDRSTRSQGGRGTHTEPTQLQLTKRQAKGRGGRRRRKRRSRRRTAQVGGVGALVGFCFGRQTLFGWQQ